MKTTTTRLACLNATEFVDKAFGFRVVHRGDTGWRGSRRVVSAVRQGIVRAMAGAERALAAWGVACRAPLHVIPATITRYDIDSRGARILAPRRRRMSRQLVHVTRIWFTEAP